MAENQTNNEIKNAETIDKVSVIIEPISKRVTVRKGTNLLKAIQKLKIPINTACGGEGTCGKCKIRAYDMSCLSPITSMELKKLTPKEIKQKYRLACQTDILNNVRIYLPEGFTGKTSKIIHDINGKDRFYPKYKLLPQFWKIALNLKKDLFSTHVSDYDLIRKALKEEIELIGTFNNYIETQYICLQKIPKIIREKEGEITVVIQTNFNSANEPIMLLNMEAGNTVNQVYGVAFDIGTTTIVGYLMNLKNGDLVETLSILNPQTSIGEDLVTRIEYAAQSEEHRLELVELLHEAINFIITKFKENHGINWTDLCEVSIVGNTIMHHFFFDLETKHLGTAPYSPVIQEPMRIRNYHLGLTSLSRNSEIFSAPIIAGYVGADTMADIIAIRMDKMKKKTLLIDIGTNGEIVFNPEPGRLVTVSCAAGSALEGAHIHSGMRGTEGAIECIKFDTSTPAYTPTIKIIGDKTPMGICGSAIIDVIAELLRAKILTRSGKFNDKIVEQLREKEKEQGRDLRIMKNITTNEYEYIIHSEYFPANIELVDIKSQMPQEFNEIPVEIKFTQSDVREVQKAKGALLAGCNLVLKNYAIKLQDLDQILLAGAFGTYINATNAKFIGLIPDLDEKDIHQIGNAAGEGSKVFLLNTKLREKADIIAKNVIYYEIANDPDFQAEYAKCMQFPHHNMENFPSLQAEYENIPMR